MEYDDLEDRLRRHEAMIEGLAKVWHRQGEMNARIDTYIERQDALNERLVGAIERIETLLTRVLPPRGNGREA